VQEALVITLAPFTDGFNGMTDVAQSVFIQALIAEASANSPNKSVVGRLVGLDKPQLRS